MTPGLLLDFLIGDIVRLLLAPNTTGPHGLFGGEFGDRKADLTGSWLFLFSFELGLISSFSMLSLSFLVIDFSPSS